MTPPARRVALVSEAARFGRARLAALDDAGFELVERFQLDNELDAETLVAGLESVWGVVAGSERYGADVLARLPDLRVIARPGVGYDRVDVEAATARGIPLLLTPGANADAVADCTLALVLASLRRLPEVDRAVREGRWRPPSLAGDLTGATVGIVGLGRIGGAVARRLRGFGCRVLASEPVPDGDLCQALEIECVALDALLEQADVVTLHAPLTTQTRGLIGARELARMRPSAILVNTSRGGLVDQDALVEALASGRIGGAALDVFEREPLPSDHPLTRMPNVILSGHAATFTRGGIAAMIDVVVANLLDVAAGRLPAGRTVNPEAWSRRTEAAPA
jgi:phosphoglycerate dehydrogenase-like enzyme